MKNPADLNIIVSSTERCGVSWFCLLLSLFHERMFGEMKKWNLRISRFIAGNEDYPIMKGWSTTQWTPIENIIKKPYDKIILLQRKLEPLKESLFIYYYFNKNYEEEKDKIEYKEWFKKIENYYEKIYAEHDSKKILRVYLEDLNNHTILSFNRILDFLNFPKERPIIFPINPPERNWQTFSSVLYKGQKLNNRLQKIYKNYSNNYVNKELEFSERKNDTFVSASDIWITLNKTTNDEIKIHGPWGFALNPHPSYKTPDILMMKKKEIEKLKKQKTYLKFIPKK